MSALITGSSAVQYVESQHRRMAYPFPGQCCSNHQGHIVYHCRRFTVTPEMSRFFPPNGDLNPTNTHAKNVYSLAYGKNGGYR